MKKLIGFLFLMVMITAAGCGSNGDSPAPAPAAGNNSQAQGQNEAHNGNSVDQVDEHNHQHEEGHSHELIVAGQEIAVSLDPVQPLTSAYLRNIGAAEALFKVNAAGEVDPELAESAAELSPTEWEIKLRPNVRFWSGAAVNADAVIASLERSRELDVQAQPFLTGMAFSKVDDYTLRIVTEREHAPVLLNLSYYQTVIHNAEAKHDAVSTMDMTGMYKVVEFVPKQKLVLVANEQYWGDKPQIGKVVYEEIAEEQTRVLSILSGRSHIALNISPSSLDQFDNNERAAIVATPAANTQTIYLNLQRPQLADERVRQALSWGLDRQELAILGAEGQSEPVTTWLGSNPAFPEAATAVYPRFDADKAGQLLDEAGWVKAADGIRYKDGSPLTLKLMTWGGDKALGEALQHQWANLGIQAEVQHGDYSLIEAARESGEWDASIEAWSTFGDEYALLAGQYGADGRGNYGGYRDEQVDQLLNQLAEAADTAARKALALQINERVAQQAPVISLFPRPQLTAVSHALQGFEKHFRQFENTVNANLKLDLH